MADIKGTVGNIIRQIGTASKEAVKTTKLSLDINSEEAALKALYVDIGKRVHEIYAYGGSLGEYFDNKYAEIKKVEANLNELRNTMNIIKGVKICSNCGAKVERNASFCPNCAGNAFDLLSDMEMKLKADSKAAAEPAEMTEPLLHEPIPHIEPLPEPPAAIEPLPTNLSPNDSAKKHCSVCGYENNSTGDKFCLSCGRML